MYVCFSLIGVEECALQTFYANKHKPPYEQITTWQQARIWIWGKDSILSQKITLDSEIPLSKYIKKQKGVVLIGCREYHMGFVISFNIGEDMDYARV